ncbi:G1 family glutamic endopeptidase [Thermogymnomonas acidicola]|uniref:G1 family glutamic endopeptidase n=1 Tax=Thermogymnomonas acidicola TaxID=399579 RepID=UPI00166D8411|nr:G1 family glutamic endopeptidase [Thermogymnomonas acidicola]
MEKVGSIVIVLTVLLSAALFSVASQAVAHPTMGGAIFSQSESLNWAGYVAVSSDYSVHNATMSLIIPDTSTSGNSYAAFWVGIDGYNDNTVEQTGILAEPSGFGHNEHTVYLVWYEFYPAAPVYASFTAQAGDYVYASVTYEGSQTFTTSISVYTPSGQLVGTLTDTATVSGALDDSAEWIVEAPSSSTGILPLANFGTAYFGYDYTGIHTTDYASISGLFAPMGAFSPTEIVMVNSAGQAMAVPSAVSSDGTSFYVTYEATSSHHGPHFGRAQ